MKINGIPIEAGQGTIIELEETDKIQLTVPAGRGRTCVHLEVNSLGMLNIRGDSSIIGKISGMGIWQKLG